MIAALCLFLKGVPSWVWQLLGALSVIAGIFFGGAHWQAGRDQVRYDELKVEYTKFVADTRAAGEQAKKDAAAREAADIQRKKDADDERSKAIADLQLDNDRLRRAGARGSTVPAAAPGTSRPDLACFDRAELSAAVDDFVAEVSDQAQSGAAATVDLDNAKRWATDSQQIRH